MKSIIWAITLGVAAVILAVPSALASTAQSDLVLGGTTVVHVSFSSADNSFDVYDDYPDRQSAAVRYRVGRSTTVFTGYNSGGEGSHRKFEIAAGGLPVRFHACRIDRNGDNTFQCTRTWKTVTGSCLKASWTAVRSRAGACLSYSGKVLHTGAGPTSYWAFEVTGQISAPGSGTDAARLQVQTHVAGNPWGSTKTVALVDHGYRKTFRKVVSSGGAPFFQRYRLCGQTCGAWTNGDGTVGF